MGRPISGHLPLAPLIDLRAGAGRAWLPLLTFLVDGITVPGTPLAHPMVAGPLYEAVVTGMLLAADHPYRDLLASPAPAWSPRGIKLAIDAIHAHPEQPFTAGSLAELAGTSVRSLQEGFRSHVGVSPMSYLREVRLIRAHEDLNNRDARTVAEVANRWGFTHLGRFAAAYASRYGRPPSGQRRGG